MADTQRTPRGLYFEEFEVGHSLSTSGRTITESDVVGFAGLSGDYNAIHTDAEYSRSTPFGRRVAHGLLVLSIASGLAVNTGLLEGTVLAFREISAWKFSLPVFIGDTIHASMEIVETKSLPRLGGGSVVIDLNVVNQDDKTVMRGRWSVLIKSRP
jgi:3-hydroxybutyryl-CoA dehydratase